MLDLQVKSELEYFIKKEEIKETLNYSLNRETSSKTFFQKIITKTFVGLKTAPSSGLSFQALITSRHIWRRAT